MPELTNLQRRTLAAAAERILPSEDGPGARETGAAEYILAALGEERLGNLFPLFAYGLDRLDELARETFERFFADLTPEEQDGVLRRLQALPDPPLRPFFARFVRLCAEAFLGRDGLGWQYVGYPPAEMKGDGCLVPIPGSETY